MEERVRMLSDYAVGHWSVSDLCQRYGVSRETFYAWRKRQMSGAQDWFVDRSHGTVCCPHRTPAALADQVIALRQRFPHMGPRKLLALLQRQSAQTPWPAASTIGDILKRAGLVDTARRRRRALDQSHPFTEATQANDEWSVDFKGWFRTRDQQRIDPLTISDSHSRFLIDIRIAPQTIDGVRPVFEQAFRTHGVPWSIRCDNGSPFGSHGAGGLTRLSTWWIKLGIEAHFIVPASPQENGRHERMHRTLKAQTSKPPADNASQQQVRFDAFRQHYNEERPHEALGQRPPADLYRPCEPRAMPERLDDPWYDADHQVRRVRDSGEIKWKGGRLFVSEALVGELVGLSELENGDHVVRFCNHDIGLIGLGGRFRRFAPPRPPKPKATHTTE